MYVRSVRVLRRSLTFAVLVRCEVLSDDVGRQEPAWRTRRVLSSNGVRNWPCCSARRTVIVHSLTLPGIAHTHTHTHTQTHTDTLQQCTHIEDRYPR